MLFPTVLPEAESGSYSIYSYLPLKHSRLCPGGFFLLQMKVSMANCLQRNEDHEYTDRDAEKHCGLPGARKHLKS